MHALLDALREEFSYACQCGVTEYLSEPDRRHAQQHFVWAHGLAIPLSVRVPVEHGAGVVRVEPKSPTPLVKLAYEMAQVFRRSQHFDFAQFPAPGWNRSKWFLDGREDEPKQRAYLGVWNRRAIAVAIIDDAKRSGRYSNKDENGPIRYDERRRRALVCGIFVCADYRRRGVARELLSQAAAMEGTRLEEMAWQLPFSSAGRALALGIVGADRLRVGA